MTQFDRFGLLEKKFGRFSKIAFYSAKSIVIKNILFFNKKCSYSNFSGHGAKLFRNLILKKLVVWPNFCLLRPEEHFEEKSVFKKTLFCFSDFERKMFGQGQKLLAAFFYRHIRCPEELLRMFLLLDLSGVSGQKILGRGVVKIAFQVSIDSFFDEKHYLEFL